MKNVFKTKLSTASLVLIPACIGINYLGKLFASVLKLPLWLDSIGTCIGGALGGPIIGAICGAANNLIYGFTTGDSITLVYALTSLGIGLAVGIMARLGNMEKISGALITSVIAGLVAVCISTPLNVIFWGGTTGNVWGDAVFAATQASNMPVLLGSFLDEVVVDVPDKIITILVVFAILKGLPKKLTALYDVNEGILYAVRISLNVLNMLLAFAVFVLTTRPAELVEDLEQIGFSPKIGYVISSVFQIVPQMSGTMNTILDAQRSRGMETEGSLLTRAKSFLPLISPVVMSSLTNTRERAIALEIRGFEAGEKKTYLRDSSMKTADRALCVCMVVLLAAAVAVRVML